MPTIHPQVRSLDLQTVQGAVVVGVDAVTSPPPPFQLTEGPTLGGGGGLTEGLEISLDDALVVKENVYNQLCLILMWQSVDSHV